MKTLRRIEGVKLLDRIRSKELRNKLGVKPLNNKRGHTMMVWKQQQENMEDKNTYKENKR